MTRPSKRAIISRQATAIHKRRRLAEAEAEAESQQIAEPVFPGLGEEEEKLARMRLKMTKAEVLPKRKTYSATSTRFRHRSHSETPNKLLKAEKHVKLRNRNGIEYLVQRESKYILSLVFHPPALCT
ncbi:hypothetical protein FN846DRAFT_912037 [Sphaerosporella brunnea]|uniref:Uncharacterized protein n=1 Tax=Sphaerosporella brunnea TaxID=1250544 RepID=A0A5J5EJU4_9PEZI|nr:hypothetical protein FN846DRAFT_912037 [Sphaerosporella brunnea]